MYVKQQQQDDDENVVGNFTLKVIWETPHPSAALNPKHPRSSPMLTKVCPPYGATSASTIKSQKIEKKMEDFYFVIFLFMLPVVGFDTTLSFGLLQSYMSAGQTAFELTP